MHIPEIWPVAWPGSNTVARFNVAVSDDIKLCGMILRRRNDGSLRAVCPRQGDNQSFHLAPHLMEQITVAARAAFAERTRDAA